MVLLLSNMTLNHFGKLWLSFLSKFCSVVFVAANVIFNAWSQIPYAIISTDDAK
jgi:hypothetical protein